MTEAEAQQKWCPDARAMMMQSGSPPNDTMVPGMIRAINTAPTLTSYNRDNSTEPPYSCRCLASKCMAWRKHGLDSSDGFCGRAGFATLDVGGR